MIKAGRKSKTPNNHQVQKLYPFFDAIAPGITPSKRDHMSMLRNSTVIVTSHYTEISLEAKQVRGIAKILFKKCTIHSGVCQGKFFKRPKAITFCKM
jgi:hypothetical protein